MKEDVEAKFLDILEKIRRLRECVDALQRTDQLQATQKSNLEARVYKLEGKVFPKCHACGQSLPSPSTPMGLMTNEAQSSTCPHCPDCGTRMLPQDGGTFRCPNCGSHSGQS
jgi:tRNA(Ile2) C34 agmatinyltransferase TiaS